MCAISETEYAKRLLGKMDIPREDDFASLVAQGDNSLLRQLAIAAIKYAIRSAFRKGVRNTVFHKTTDCHHLAFRIERELPDHGTRFSKSRHRYAALFRNGQHGTLGRISDHGYVILFVPRQDGIVTENSNFKNTLQDTGQFHVMRFRCVTAHNNARRCIPDTGDRILLIAGVKARHRHLILRKRPRLVGADRINATECLDGEQTFDDRILLSHPIHAERKQNCHDGGQSFGYRRDGQADRRHEERQRFTALQKTDREDNGANSEKKNTENLAETI